MLFYDVTGPSLGAGLIALRDVLDLHLGFPDGNGTLHAARPHAHPTTQQRWKFEIRDAWKPFVDAVVAACKAAVTGGTATAAQTAIANLPAYTISVDSTWVVSGPDPNASGYTGGLDNPLAVATGPTGATGAMYVALGAMAATGPTGP